MTGKRAHWAWEWLLSHLAWEGFRWIFSSAAVGMLIAFLLSVYRWFTGHPNWTLTILSFLGTVITAVVSIDRANARKMAPILRLRGPRSEGLYDVQENVMGLTVRVTNDQRKFHTIAHNVRASLEFRHSLGDRIKIFPALWVVREQLSESPERMVAPGRRRLVDSVSIGMEQQESLLILFWHTSQALSFRTSGKAPLVIEEASSLVLGEWRVIIRLAADNSRLTKKLNLSLGPYGVGVE